MHQRHAPILTDVAIGLVHAELLSGWKTSRSMATTCQLSIRRVKWCVQYLALSRPVFMRWTVTRRFREYRMYPEASAVQTA